MALHAAWLGSWSAPWALQRGRRWGDPAWTLVALAQAWLLGGRQGCWPKAQWHARWPEGPRVVAVGTDCGARPEPSWVALLRHGSSAAEAERPGRREDESQIWAWSQLLAGNGAPWMALAARWFTLEQRRKLFPLLAAVDDLGCLQVPPFLEDLVPQAYWTLPDGWWRLLLGSMGPDGRLLPDGGIEAAAAWLPLLESPERLQPLFLPQKPKGLEDAHWFATATGEGLIDPRIRAWGRGYGAGGPALAPWSQACLAVGGDPSPLERALLDGRLPDDLELPEGWRAILAADFAVRPLPTVPPRCGHPVLDRIRVRWSPDLPPAAAGYPPWGTQAHPCADPFHWLAEGFHAFRKAEMEAALRAFTLAHAHFLRLSSPFWAARTAANAWMSASFWADHRAMAAWLKLRGVQTPAQDAYDEALLLATRGEFAAARGRLERLFRQDDTYEPAWLLLADLAIFQGQDDVIRRVVTHLPPSEHKLFLEAYLLQADTLPEAVQQSDLQLMWLAMNLRWGRPVSAAFWEAWAADHNQINRLMTGLMVLSCRPEDRTGLRLLGLQAIADRSGSEFFQSQLATLWPQPEALDATDPLQALEAWRARSAVPVWLLAGLGSRARLLGPPTLPEGLESRWRQTGSFGPMELQGQLWWGRTLTWQGAVVGGFLLATPVADGMPDLDACALIAPWLAQVAPKEAPEPLVMPHHFLMDGSEPMASVLREVQRIAPTELPMLLLGPSGSGKELLAREIHERSGRTGALVPVNCSAFVETLLESELFGHVRGAFTGADRDRKGAIETADGGTLFLDEVADLSPRLQSLFLRVLQEKEVRRVGSDRSHRVSVRFLAATHKPLEALAAAGQFRRDLLYRLQGCTLTLPSLRDRRHEFPYLIPRLAGRAAASLNVSTPELAPELVPFLAKHAWPGNFRELGHALERALLRRGGAPLAPEHFPELGVAEGPTGTWEEATRAFQKTVLRATLSRHRFQMAEAATTLGLTRTGLYLAARRVGFDIQAERQRWEHDRESS